MFGYHWLDSDHFALYLLDVSGHGVGSSLLAVSVNNLLASQSLPNTNCREPGEGAGPAERYLPDGKAAREVLHDLVRRFRSAQRTLSYSNAGHPPGLLYMGPSAAEAALQRLQSVDLAAGMIEGTEYDTQTVPLGPFARLLLYSDGVYEIARPGQPMWKFQEFVDFVSGLPREEPVGDRLLVHVRQLGASESLADDFSVLEVQF